MFLNKKHIKFLICEVSYCVFLGLFLLRSFFRVANIQMPDDLAVGGIEKRDTVSLPVSKVIKSFLT